MGEAVDHSFSQMDPVDIRELVTYLRSIPAVASSEPATIAPPAPASPKEGGAIADALGRKVFAQACVSCHSWTGVSALQDNPARKDDGRRPPGRRANGALGAQGIAPLRRAPPPYFKGG
jgi:mono/diheme cytochrome c family protein